ncbi:capsular exopolysaccharide synthesis family protein [Micromonospora palomenae]|uniref:non-specific protein-tyrosine kinase n=1 Tax=Micromonospora palomenae TaxID=1461247 RepID=A0A561VHU7_9ACTN|nr:polysaccharide biosynthesis tyrosine autokinase [Micromonospora palomenae]TWG11181.1 capsular exopolysaccharide synthesis family protein [Micromonospora palomenae]
MSLADYIRLIRAHWIMVVLATASGVTLAAIHSATQSPVYEATVQLFVSASGKEGDNSQLNQGGIFSQQRVKSYAALVASPDVAQTVITSLDLPYTPAELVKNIETETPPDTVLLDITVRDGSPERARDIANEIAEEFPRLVDKIETPKGETNSPVKVSVTQQATASDEPVAPRTKLNVALGLILGLGLGLGGAILRGTFDRTIRGKRDAEQAAGAPVLGAAPQDSKKSRNPLIADEQATARAEAFRQLRTNIRFLSIDRRITSFVVTSSLPAEGKTTTAANLAIALAQAGQAVVLVDADLRRPSVADTFALSNGVGLTNVLLGDVGVNQAMQQWRGDLPLYILPAGPTPPNPSELLGSTRLTKVVASLESAGMTVIFDSPPLLPVTDAAIIARMTGGALVVARAGSTRTDQLATAVQSLRSVGAPVLGLVVNRVKPEKAILQNSYYNTPAPRRSRSKS